jgi:hypothetical protein
MDDVQRQDRRIFLKELLSPGRLLLTIGAAAVVLANFNVRGVDDLGMLIGILAGILTISALGAYKKSLRKRFRSKRYEALWTACNDRLERFETVLKQMRRDRVAELKEMPRTIRSVGQGLYLALRRADVISDEIQQSERGMIGQPPGWAAAATDPQSKELYRIADKNIAEYRQQYAGVMAGVQRTEAQSAVFMTTLDTLRMKILGYRLVGRSPEIPSRDFLEALAEAKLQLQAIDMALEELELGPFPTTITVMPPPFHPDLHEEGAEEQRLGDKEP